jgi:signal transduction histidine kinase
MSPLRILLLEDDPSDAGLVQATLEADGIVCDVTVVKTHAEFLTGLESRQIDLVLADYKLPSFDGLSALKLLLTIRPDIPFIFVSGTFGEDSAIEALKIGATDYVLKTRLSKLVPSVRRAMREKEERQKAEDAKRRSDEERERLRQLEEDLARISRVSMMAELTASLSHEIKQPISAAVMNVQTCLRLLERDPPDTEALRRMVSRIVDDVNRACTIIDRNHALYRGAVPRRESIDLNEIIQEIVALTQDAALRHSISIRTELDRALPGTTGDRVQLQQVLMNLTLNAIDAMKSDGGELRVASSRHEHDFLLISVIDSGAGLPPEGQGRIFEAFFTTKPQGTGMGLSISRRIVESHGGRLWPKANPERGATFCFTLPIATS